VGSILSGTFNVSVGPYTLNGTTRDWMYFLADRINIADIFVIFAFVIMNIIYIFSWYHFCSSICITELGKIFQDIVSKIVWPFCNIKIAKYVIHLLRLAKMNDKRHTVLLFFRNACRMADTDIALAFIEELCVLGNMVMPTIVHWTSTLYMIVILQTGSVQGQLHENVQDIQSKLVICLDSALT
jgi:hypothetical protein